MSTTPTFKVETTKITWKKRFKSHSLSWCSHPSAVTGQTGLSWLSLCCRACACVTSSGSPSGSSLLYRVQVLLESAGHAGDQVDVVVHAAAHAAVHQRANGWLLGARVEEILRLVVAVHRAPGEAILRGRRKQKSLRRQLEKFGRRLFLGTKSEGVGCSSSGFS